jgi:hypothetical protein
MSGPATCLEPSAHASGHRRGYVADPDGNWIALISAAGA